MKTHLRHWGEVVCRALIGYWSYCVVLSYLHIMDTSRMKYQNTQIVRMAAAWWYAPIGRIY